MPRAQIMAECCWRAGHGRHDPSPGCHAIMITGGCELVGADGAFLQNSFTIDAWCSTHLKGGLNSSDARRLTLSGSLSGAQCRQALGQGHAATTSATATRKAAA